MRARALLVCAALLALACREHEEAVRREETLKANLAQVRLALAAYRADNGRYPSQLQDLVPRYLKTLPADPFGGEWRVETEETVLPNSDFQTTTSAAPPSVVIDVHSSAPGKDASGVPYANY